MNFYKKFLTKDNLIYLSGMGWGIIGVNRGCNYYEYEHEYDKKSYYYIDKIFYGIAGLLIYINPCFLPITTYKELYRLEINLRGLKEEKKNEYYKILF